MSEAPTGNVVVERFDKGRHDRAPFESSYPKYTRYLKEIAGQHGKRGLNALYVAIRQGDEPKACVFGYFTASMSAITADDMDKEIRDEVGKDLGLRSVERIRIPALHIGMLATDQTVERKGLGQFLLTEAGKLAIGLRPVAGCWGLTLDVDEEHGERLLPWYRARNFSQLRRDRLLMAQPLSTLERALKAGTSR